MADALQVSGAFGVSPPKIGLRGTDSKNQISVSFVTQWDFRTRRFGPIVPVILSLCAGKVCWQATDPVARVSGGGARARRHLCVLRASTRVAALGVRETEFDSWGYVYVRQKRQAGNSHIMMATPHMKQKQQN